MYRRWHDLRVHRRPRACARRSAAPSPSTGSTSTWRRARSTASSAPTAPGKSTTIRVLLGLLRADGGSATASSAATRGTTPRRCTAASPTSPATSPCGPTSPAVRSSTCSAGCAAASTTRRRRRAARAVRPRPHQEGPRLLQGQPAEGRPRRGPRLRRRAAPARRAHLGPRPADGGGLPRVIREVRRRGPHRAPLEPHPQRGGARSATGSPSSAPAAPSRPGSLADLRHLSRTTVDADLDGPGRRGEVAPPGVARPRRRRPARAPAASIPMSSAPCWNLLAPSGSAPSPALPPTLEELFMDLYRRPGRPRPRRSGARSMSARRRHRDPAAAGPAPRPRARRR